LIQHIIKQYNISSTELFTEYTLTIKQHKSHAKLQTKIAKKYRQKRSTMYRSEQEPTWQVPLWTPVQDPHTDAPT
jgi:phage gpG-like protein